MVAACLVAALFGGPPPVQSAGPEAKKPRRAVKRRVVKRRVVKRSVRKSRRAYTDRIGSAADFLAYSKEVANERFTKFVLSVDGKRMIFFDVNTYPVHKSFVFSQIYREKLTPERVKAAIRRS